VYASFGTPSSEHQLKIASRTAENDFHAKQCSKINTRSTRDYTLFAPAKDSAQLAIMGA
jgi:hypothetical protein